MKKITILLLALCLLIISAPALPGNIASASPADFVWTRSYTDNSVYTEGTLEGDVVIPDNLEGEAVYALMYSALNGQNEITSLTMPNTLYALQNAAISDMEKLESVTLNDELEVIAYRNFSDCPALTSLTIPASVKVIEGSISSCDNLREIRFEGMCPKFMLPIWCFYWLPDDYVIYVPDDQLDAYAEALKDVNDAASHLRPSGQNAIIPETPNYEDWFVFEEYTGSITGYKEYHAYVKIPESIGGIPVQNIAESACKGDYNIYALEFPEGLERIEHDAFCNSGNIMYIKFPSTLEVIGESAFFDAQVSRIDWSEGLREIGANAFRYHHENILTLPSTLKTIGDSAFENARCQELYLSGDLESIGSRAFASNTFLYYMEFDFHEPIWINDDAFVETSVTELILPWDSSFENQAQYAEILRDQCPDCTVWIKNPANAGIAEYPVYDESICMFENGVWTMYKGDQPDLCPWTQYSDDCYITALGDGVFKGSQTIRSFYPHHYGWFTTIGDEAFADSSLEYIEPFGTIEIIGRGAFRNCLNLTDLTLPASLTYIGEDALAGCDNLETLTVLCDPAILPEGLLDECASHTEIFAAPDATDEQVRILSEKAHRPWYTPVSRVGEAANELIEMPYAMLLIDDFWYDTEYARLDRYHGYELNLYLPREAEGTTLTALGIDMMGRARPGDNYDLELPVRSVFIPETYTEIPYFAFENCETLETVVCYAPIETLDYGTFAGCTNLREVVFVNGVRNLDKHIFSDCPNLETVYLGPNVEFIDEYAFLNMDGTPGFDPDRVITDPAQMPDVEALLEAVKSDPMPEPTPAPTPAPAVPVGEAGAAYVGQWQAIVLEMDGMTFSVADLEAELRLTLNADGTAESFDGEFTESGTWFIENGLVIISGNIEGLAAMTPNEEGQLVMEQDGTKLFFEKTDGEDDYVPSFFADPSSPELVVGEAGATFIGKWQADTFEMDGVTYPVADMGMDMSFTLNADGTAESFDGEFTESGTWLMNNGLIIIEGVVVLPDEEGRLVMEEDGTKLFFVRADGETDSEPITSAGASSPELSVGEAGAAYVGQWQAITLEMDGMTFSVADLGAEMRLTLNADGTAESFDGEFTEAGTWSMENGLIIIEGVAVIPNEEGQLVMEEDGTKLFFEKTDGETESEPSFFADPSSPELIVGEAGATFIGKWQADTFEMDGVTYPVADMGMDMSFTLNADGTAESFDGEFTESGTWSMENGLIIIEGVAVIPDEEGRLVMEEDGTKLFFVRADGEAVPATTTNAASEPETGFIGTWYGCYMVTGMMSGDPREMFEIQLIINADGTASLAFPTSESYHWTENEDGSLQMVKDIDNTEMPLLQLDENFICFGSMDGDGNAFGGYLIFSRDAQAIWTPDMLGTFDVPAVEEPAASSDVSSDLSARMDVRYVCQSAEASGITLNASMLGGEYALTFHANGTVDFVMVGNTIPGLKWTQNGNALVIDYYGTAMEAVMTENGFDMNYFDTMMMHFVAQ